MAIIGTAYVELRPDTRRFASLTAQALAGISAKGADLAITPNTARFAPELQRSIAPALARGGDVAVRAETKRFGADVAGAVRTVNQRGAEVEVRADASRFGGAVRKAIAPVVSVGAELAIGASGAKFGPEVKEAIGPAIRKGADLAVRPDAGRFGSDLDADVDPALAGGRELEVRPDTKGFGAALEGGIGSAVRRAAGLAAAAFAGVQVGGFFKDAIAQSSDLNESANVVNLTFKDQASTILAASKTSATAVGLTTSAYQQAASNVGGLLSNMGYTSAQSAQTSQSILKLGADLGSAFNKDPAQAVEAIGSALRGESDPIQAFNVTLNAAAVSAKALELGLYSGKGEISDNAKAQATLAIITAQTSQVTGDFANTSTGLANAQRVASAGVGNLKAVIGTALLPVLSQAVVAFNQDILPALTVFAEDKAPKAAEAISAVGDGLGGVFAILAKGNFAGADLTFGLQEDSKVVGVLFAIREGVLGVIGAATLLATGNYAGPGSLFGQLEDSTLADVLLTIRESVGIAGTAIRDAFAAGSIAPITDALAAADFSKIGDLFTAITGQGPQAGDDLASIGQSLSELLPFVGALVSALPNLGDILGVSAAVLGFFADHVDTLITLMPLIVAGFVAFKLAQIASNIVGGLSIPLGVIQATTIRAQIAATRELTAAILGEETVQQASLLTRARALVVTGAHKVATAAMAGATKVASIAQAGFNAVMSGNPIALVVIAVAALVAGLVYFFTQTETGQRIFAAAWAGIKNAAASVVDWFTTTALPALSSVWEGIKAGVSFLWTGVIQPVWGFIKNGFDAVASGVNAAWTNVLSPVFTLIGAILAAVWNDVIKPVFGFLLDGFKGMVSGVQDAWTNVLKPVFDLVGSVISAVWENVIKPVLGFIGTAWALELAGMKIIWETVLKPAFDAVGSALSAVWENVIKPVLGFISATWDAVLRGMEVVWRTILAPVFRFLGDAVGTAKSAFETGVTAIGTAWDKLKEAAKAPVRFVVDKVINGALIGNFNKLADFFEGKNGASHIPLVKLPDGFKRGGWTGEGSADQAAGVVHADEFVVRKPSQRRLRREHPGLLDHLNAHGALPPDLLAGYRTGGLVALGKSFQAQGAQVAENKAFGTGRVGGHSKGSRHYAEPPDDAAIDVNTAAGASAAEMARLRVFAAQAVSQGFRVFLNSPGFPHAPGHDNHLHVDTHGGAATGGPSAGSGGLLSQVVGALGDPSTLLSGAVDKLLPGIGTSPLAGLVAAVPKKLIGLATTKITGLLGSLGDVLGGGDGGHGPVNQTAAGAGVQRWIPQVLESLHLVGQPDSLVQTTLRRMQQESGGNPRAINLNDVNAKNGDPSKGLMQVIGATFRANALPGHNTDIYDPVSNITASMHYALKRYKSLPKAYDRPGSYDNGGLLGPGQSGVNLLRRPERVLTPRQTDLHERQTLALERGANGQPVVNVYVQAVPDGAYVRTQARVELGEQLATLADNAYYGR